MSSRLSSRAPLEPFELTYADTNIKFFVPRVKKADMEIAYQAMIASIVDQFKWTVLPRRIESIKYRRDRKVYTAKVGSMEMQEQYYEVVAIFEASVYIVVTRTAKGEVGPSILVGTDEVMQVNNFKV